MPTKITDLTVHDIRFPTSRTLDGSDAMNPTPDYSAAYLVLETNAPQGYAGHGLTFTIAWWIEEPTSPDDVLGHARIRNEIAPIGVATGKHCQNRVMFKQLLQAKAIDFCQIDSARLGGLNEVIIVLLMAAKFGVPVCPHAGGVGLCEYVQHISLFDYISVSASLEKRVLEYVDHLHDHFLDPVVIRNGRYLPPGRPGYSITMRPETLEQFDFPNGPAWKDRNNQQRAFKAAR
jgi:Enolase C-terminal domain-like